MSVINLKATSPSGKIYIGDPCYVMKRELYDKLFDKMNWDVPGGCSIETEVLPGVFACAGTTKHGDGWYETGSVDSGTIGAVPIEACDQAKLFPKKEPGKFSFPTEYMIWDTKEVKLEYGTDSCQFSFYSDFDNIVVDTDEGAYDEEGEEEGLDESKVDNRRRVREHFDIFVKAEQKIQDIIDDLQSGSPTFSKKYERSTIREIWESLSTGRSWARFYAWLNETNSPLVELVVDEDVPNTKETLDKLAEALIYISEGLGILTDDLCISASCDHDVMDRFNESEIGKALGELWKVDFETNAIGDQLALLYSKAGVEPSKAAKDHFVF